MLFLYPHFLFASLLLIIPILIHLFNFRRYLKIQFSNVQFLKEVQEQQSSKKNLKERLILLARLLSFTFLILAFSKPYLPTNRDSKLLVSKQKMVSVFIDNSFSMQTLNQEGTLLDEAKQRAKELALTYDINDRFQILTQDFEGYQQRLLSRSEFIEALDTIKISSLSRRFDQILSRQHSLLDLQKNDASFFYIISDFQRNLDIKKSIKTDSSNKLNLIQLQASHIPNLAVDSVELLNAVHQPGNTEKLVIQLHNYSDEKIIKTPLKLLINGVQKALGSFNLNPREVQNDTLMFSGLMDGWQNCLITVQDNPVTFDNQFYFSFEVKKKLNVLLIDGGTPNPYLKAAFATDLFFDTKTIHDGNVDYATLNSYPVIFISDIDKISNGLSQQLKTYVNNGGSLVVIPSTNIDIFNYQSFLNDLNVAYPEKLISDSVKVVSLNLQNKVFKNIFEYYPKNPDLPSIKKYYQLSRSSKNTRESLLNLTSDQSLISSYGVKHGKLYLSAVALDDQFSNLQKHGLFLPIILRIALLSEHDQSLFYTIGNFENFEIPLINLSANEFLKIYKNGKYSIPNARQIDGKTQLFLSDQIKTPGIYQLKKQDSLIADIAYNINRSESDLSYYSQKELSDLLPSKTNIIHLGTDQINLKIRETNFGIQLWKLCIILALFFLSLEILLIKYFKIKINAT